ncbi:MAG: thioredoxin fold domain-containing protein [Anaerolineales bacterium]|nr:thioredoxin fold domain-containing protein [Anaerolineales bacterium]
MERLFASLRVTAFFLDGTRGLGVGSNNQGVSPFSQIFLDQNYLLLTAMNFSEFQQKTAASGKPVIVDFWAAWCMPCKVTKPILERLAAEYASRIEFIAIDADDSRPVLEKFRIFGIPTLLALRNGQEVGRLTGASGETQFRAFFDALAEGKEIKVSLAPIDRIIRLGGGAILAAIGLSTGNWLVVALGGILAFLGIYDRCPVWNAITGLVHRKLNTSTGE